MNSQDILEQSNRCLADDAPPCGCACPLGVDIKGLVEKLRRGQNAAAYRLLKRSTVFPSIVAHICDAPCESACLLAPPESDPLAVREFERFLCRAEYRDVAAYRILPKKQRIGIVGGGLAGLSCAWKLIARGYRVSLYEATGQLGGKLRALPAPILPPECLERELRPTAGADFLEIHLNTDIAAVGDDLTIAGVTFDAVVAATGDDQFADVRFPGLLVLHSCREQGPLEAIRQGVAASYSVESLIKTGRMDEKNDAPGSCSKCVPGLLISPSRCQVKARLGAWTEPDVRQEAGRCQLCSCRACLNVCDLLEFFGKNPRRALVESAGVLGKSVTGGTKAALRQALACTQCGACQRECPVDIDLGRIYLDLRRTLNHRGSLPVGYYAYYLEDQRFACNEAALLLGDAQPVSYVYFPGCQIGASRPEQTIRSWQAVRLASGGTAALQMTCCGAPAAWAGDERLHREALAAIKKAHASLGRPTYLLACPSCARMFAKYLPTLKTRMLWEWLLEQDILPPATQNLPDQVTVFDPCASADVPDTQKAVRQLLRRCGFTPRELPDELRARCCGYGGLISQAAPELHADIRSIQAALNGSPFVAYCSNCRDSLAAAGQQAYHLFDLLFSEVTSANQPPTLSQRRQNRLVLKQRLVGDAATDAVIAAGAALGDAAAADQSVVGAASARHSASARRSFECLIPEGVRAVMQRELMLDEDVEAVIAHARETRASVFNPANDEYTAHLRRGYNTFWVRFAQLDESRYELRSVYSHRMSIAAEGAMSSASGSGVTVMDDAGIANSGGDGGANV
ncbi:MAG: NAD(P)-binding protein [Coriobacteriales bacterium]|jgi:Fe-S oxidoreductase|nr:NAD(P)-binding protein [Coriobacteriales bacterium]